MRLCPTLSFHKLASVVLYPTHEEKVYAVWITPLQCLYHTYTSQHRERVVSASRIPLFAYMEYCSADVTINASVSKKVRGVGGRQESIDKSNSREESVQLIKTNILQDL